jgi:DnaA family protein
VSAAGIQLPLGIRLRPEATFESYLAGLNREALDYLRARFDAGRNVYLWGGAGTGKTHLLHAACQAAGARGEGVVYLPLGRSGELAPELLDGLETLALVCIDDLQSIAGLQEWERRLFALFNAVRERGGRLLLAADRPPRSLGVALEDLRTRFAWDLVFQLQPLGDDELEAALIRRAQALGMELPDEVARYLVQRLVRDVATLFRLLDLLERESLSAQRRLTVPFVRGVLEEHGL